MFDNEFINTDPRVVHMDDDHKYMYYGEGDNPHAGIFYIHKDKQGEWCSTPLEIKPEDNEPQYEGSAWHVMDNDYENLSLEPSIICTICASHGYIVKNEWQDPFAGMPDVPIEWILSECKPAPYQGFEDWQGVFSVINATQGAQIEELKHSYAEVGEFWNPIMIKENVVVEGRVRLWVAMIFTGMNTFRVHFLPPDKEDQEADTPSAVLEEIQC